MLPLEAKRKAVTEYFRVLKPGGFLLTHDVMLLEHNEAQILATLREVINVSITPLTKEGWKDLFKQAGFSNVDTYSGEMTLLSPKGMIYDEGVLGTLKLYAMHCVLKIGKLSKMFRFFNDPQNKMHFIAVCSQNNKLMGSAKSAHFYTIIFYLSRTLQPDFQLSFAIAH